MVVTHSLDVLKGQPRIENTNFTVETIVRCAENKKIDELCRETGLNDEQIRLALSYCKEKVCTDVFARYCSGCALNSAPVKFKRRLWETADKIYTKYFEV